MRSTEQLEYVALIINNLKKRKVRGFEREYLKHLLKLLTGDWEEQLGNINE